MPLNRSKLRNISIYRHQEKLTSLVNKKTIRYHLDKLIREFNILPEERTQLIVVKHVLKTLFWATVYLSFSYLTITSTFEVIHQYSHNQTTTQMKAVINNNVTYLPNMTICFKINTSVLFNTSSSYSYNYTLAWSRFFEETISPEGIFEVHENQTYDDEIYLSLLKYLAMIYEAERAWEPGLTQISTFHSEDSDDWIALKKVLVPNIDRFNITLKQLQSIFDGKFCYLPEYRVAQYSCSYLLALNMNNYQLKCIAGSKISFISIDTICFRLIGFQNYLQPMGTAEVFDFYLYDDSKNQPWYHEITIDLGTESRSAPRRATTQNETYAYYYNRFTGKIGIETNIGIKALYRKLPCVKDDVQCSSDASREECESKCLRGWIRAHCHCSPITFNLTADTSNYRSCTVDDYSICLKKYEENATYLCTNKCVPLCEQWHYMNKFIWNYDYIKNTLSISPRTFDYVIIEQVFTRPSFEEFIGALGGALGIWLGLDFVIIIEIIVNLLKGLIKKILMRNAPISEEDEHRTSANIKDREKTDENGISSSNVNGSRIAGNQKSDEENESEIAGTSIRQKNEREQQRISRKNRESNALKEKHEQQRRKRSNNIRVDSAMLDDKIKIIDGHDGRLQKEKVNTTDSIDAVQDEYTAHANYSWFLQNVLLLFLKSDASTNKRLVFLRLVEKLFWAAIYLVGSVFTTRWCIDLINLYLEDEAIYFPSLIINRTVSLPPTSLCFYYQNDYQSFESYENISNALMDYFDQPDIDRVSFIKISNETTWPKQLVYIGLLYFSTLAISETDYLNVNFADQYKKQLDYSFGSDNLIRNDIDKSLHDIFLPKLLEWKVTTNELLQKLGAELARMAELKITFTNISGTIDIVNKTSYYTAAITGELLCYGLSYAVNFTDPGDVLEFSVNRTSYSQLLSQLGGSYMFFSDFLLEPRSEQYHLSWYSSVYGIDHFLIYYGEELKGLITVDSLYTSRPASKGVVYCSPDMTKSHCRAQCRIKLIEKLCNCSPTYWTMMIRPTSGLDECTFDRYMECLNYTANDDLDCKKSCLPSCSALYGRSDSTRHWRSPQYSNTSAARISVKNGIYLSIKEQPIFTLNNMLIKV